MCCPCNFTPYRDVNCKDLAIFFEATRELRIATYKPYLVAIQEARGINFRFICNSFIMTRPPQNAITMVSIFKPFCKEGEKEEARAVVTNICKMGCYKG
ncbi:MAG TPA: hypothetical protein DEQ64_06180 [Lachnoclostridium sp.]|nr:hypothetical protein [Lachnoclostridium sp.]